jgi:2'-5' RNA ligase
VPVPVENLHLTLAFLGPVARTRIAELVALGREVHAGCFELVLDRYGEFPHARAVWIGPANVPAGLSVLRSGLCKRLRPAGFACDPGFTPHVTLRRKGRLVPQSLPSVLCWPVDRWALLESASSPHGVRYRPLAVFTLAGAS